MTMTINRRNFLKAVAGSGAMLAAGGQSALASEKKLPPEAVGILYDSNLCIGCQACMHACKEANNMPVEHTGPNKTWDNPIDLSSKTLNIIKIQTNGNESYFIKRQCMHCLNPACVNACPVSALQKDKTTGVVTYNKEACIGCRYCQVACPYNIPKFEWDNPFPQIQKCQLCDHLYEQGRYAACCESCPTGASLFGPVKELRKEAERRLMMTPGKYYQFPVNSISSGKTRSHKAKPYTQHIYGAEEVGGSQCMMLAGVDFKDLGLPDLPKTSYVSDLESISKNFYKYMIYPVFALGGLIYIVRKRHDHE